MSDDPITAAMQLILQEDDELAFNSFLSKLAGTLRTLDDTGVQELTITNHGDRNIGVLMTWDRYRELRQP